MAGDLLSLLQNFEQIRPLHLPKKSRVEKAREQVVRRWGEAEAPRISMFDLEECATRIRRLWNRTHSLEVLTGKDLRWLPWVLCHPLGSPSRWLANDQLLLERYAAFLGGSNRSRRVLQLLRVLLLRYPQELLNFDRWRLILQRLVLRSDLPQLIPWKHRCKALGLLGRNAPSEFAEKLRESPGPEEFLKAAGMEGELRQSAFVQRVIEEVASAIGRDLKRGQSSPQAIERLLAVLLVDDVFRFSTLRDHLARSLLGPFSTSAPPADLENALIQLFFRTHGDPRILPAPGWDGVDAESRNILMRWLVRTSIEDFLALIRKTALEDHWRYREKFWRAYLKEGAISDAWIVLGKRARERKATTDPKSQSGFGYLEGQASSDQSVLLLKIRQLVIAEWSHSGSCRIWFEGRKSAPKLYQLRYRAWSLQAGEDYRIVHQGSDRGRWQRQLADYIFKWTSIRVERSRYFR